MAKADPQSLGNIHKVLKENTANIALVGDNNMKAIHNNRSQLFQDCMMIMFLCGTIGIALKFVTFFNQWVYFPSFPNMLDSAFLISAVTFFAWKAFKRR